MLVSSATKQGQYGSQIWVSTRCGFRVQQEAAVNARITSLIGTSKGDSRKYQFVSAHCPIEAAAADDKADFHDALTS
eukprot:7651760-Karenia_brevis.AAC.1